MLAGGEPLPVVTLDAAVARLLNDGGLSLGLVGALVHAARDRLDVDTVREILKAARRGERFQPLLELLEVA